MEVILKQNVDRLGKTGTIVKVKDGFARNFLLPNGLAVALTPENLKKLEQERQKESLQLEHSKKEALALREKLSGLSVTISVLTHEDKLYGSITNSEIAQALKEEGFDIDKNKIILQEPIRSLGIYEVSVKLASEVEARVKVWVVKK
ncbi:MAG: 50S ribosomal protein L9 [Candidatus Omnitrophota bacterium]|nr:MAG: 50S ribosomal protein L9 [Candidatus Omnitrophota bacterium]